MTAAEQVEPVIDRVTHEVRLILMSTGGVTLAQVEEHARPMAERIVAIVRNAAPAVTDQRVDAVVATLIEQPLSVFDDIEWGVRRDKAARAVLEAIRAAGWEVVPGPVTVEWGIRRLDDDSAVVVRGMTEEQARDLAAPGKFGAFCRRVTPWEQA